MRFRVSLLALTFALASSVPAGEKSSPLRFTEVTKECGLGEALSTALNHGVAWGDCDGDGKLDIFLGNFADRPKQPKDGINTIYRQVAPGKFEYFPCPAVEKKGRCSGAVFVDLDNDGHLDLVVSSNTLPKGKVEAQMEITRIFRNPGDGKYSDVTEGSGIAKDLYRSRDIGVFDFDGDGLLDLFLTCDVLVPRDKVDVWSRLYRNLGGFKFEDVTEKVGLPKDILSLGVAVGDINGDGKADFFTTGSNRLFLSQPGNKFKEAVELRPLFEHKPLDRGEDITCGASFGDIDLDGDLDLIVGPHYPEARIKVFLNEGVKDGMPKFREITKDLGIPIVPQKAPHTDIQDFDNDGLPDLYWSAWFAEGGKRWPFICSGLGMKDGLPRFDVPAVLKIPFDFARKNVVPKEGVGMVYYVDGPAVDFDGDGDLDFFAGIWPDEYSKVFRNDTKGGNWLHVTVQGTKLNRQGIGAHVRLYEAGKAGKKEALIGFHEITVNGGYSSGRPAIAYFGLGTRTTCDVVVATPSASEPRTYLNVKSNQVFKAREEK